NEFRAFGALPRQLAAKAELAALPDGAHGTNVEYDALLGARTGCPRSAQNFARHAGSAAPSMGDPPESIKPFVQIRAGAVSRARSLRARFGAKRAGRTPRSASAGNQRAAQASRAARGLGAGRLCEAAGGSRLSACAASAVEPRAEDAPLVLPGCGRSREAAGGSRLSACAASAVEPRAEDAPLVLPGCGRSRVLFGTAAMLLAAALFSAATLSATCANFAVLAVSWAVAEWCGWRAAIAAAGRRSGSRTATAAAGAGRL